MSEKTFESQLHSEFKEQGKRYTIEEFAHVVKEKYPQYDDFSDAELAFRIIKKYPGFGDKIQWRDIYIGEIELD